jgi:hypothetical protein
VINLSGDTNAQSLYLVMMKMIGTEGDTYGARFERIRLVERNL